jgi:hypothetical protein
MVGSTGKKLVFADCEPIRAFARRTERSIEAVASCEGQRLPLSSANFESALFAVAQFRHGSAKLCPDAISHSTGNNETKATFTRSITALTTHRSHRSFRIQSDCLSQPYSSIAVENRAITNPLHICTQL